MSYFAGRGIFQVDAKNYNCAARMADKYDMPVLKREIAAFLDKEKNRRQECGALLSLNRQVWGNSLPAQVSGLHGRYLDPAPKRCVSHFYTRNHILQLSLNNSTQEIAGCRYRLPALSAVCDIVLIAKQSCLYAWLRDEHIHCAIAILAPVKQSCCD